MSDVLFIDLETWGKSGNSLVKHAQRGSHLLIEGELKQSSWASDDANGKEMRF